MYSYFNQHCRKDYAITLQGDMGNILINLPNLSGCLPKILITQIGHKIDFLQILYVNYTLSGYFKNTFRLGSECFLRQFTRGVSWWTKMDILLVQKMPIFNN